MVIFAQRLNRAGMQCVGALCTLLQWNTRDCDGALSQASLYCSFH
jgi:hypothetical protein